MDLSHIQNNIDIIPTVVFIADENLNLIYKNNYSRLCDTKTRIGASLSHYVNQADLQKIKNLNNKDGVLADFTKSYTIYFAVIRYDYDKTYYVLFDAYPYFFVESRIFEANQLPSKDLINHFNTITDNVFTEYNNNCLIEPDRLISRRLKINQYLRRIMSITKFQDFNASYSSHNIAYELRCVVQMFELLAKSVGVPLNIDIKVQEIYVKCIKGDIFLLVSAVLHFAMTTAAHKAINITVFNFEKTNYIAVDYATYLPKCIVNQMISNNDALDEISKINQYENFYLIKLAKVLLKKCSGDLSFTTPGCSLSNIRVLIKLSDDENKSSNFYESNGLENQIIELYNTVKQKYNERIEDTDDE